MKNLRLKTSNFQGYFRRAEVQFSTFHFVEALQSYRQALLLQPDDTSIMNAIARADHECQKDRKGAITLVVFF
jgi:cytochrome c-type biogenesis protein CcmH/NrfG